MTKRQKTGLLVLLSPFIAWFTIIVIQVIVRFVLSGAGDGGIIIRILNLISLIVGMIATLGFLPAIIIGIVLLATPSKK